MSFLADLWAARASLRASSRIVSRFSNAGRKVLPRGGYGRGSYP